MSDVYDHPEYRALLAAVCAAPDDDLPRMVLADWLEENGEGERAEFIRVCCGHRERGDDPIARILGGTAEWATCGITPDWSWGGGGTADPYPDPVVVLMSSGVRLSFYRGFAYRVSGPLHLMHGGECGRCGGQRYDTRHSTGDGACPECSGTGRTPGVLGPLLRREPVGEDGIVVTTGGVFRPFNYTDGTPGVAVERNALPADVWTELCRQCDITDDPLREPFPTPDAARQALSRALFALHAPKSEVTADRREPGGVAAGD